MKKIRNLSRLTWQKDFYPPPEPLPRRQAFWIALGLVALAVLVYSLYFSMLLTTKHDAFQTSGYDLGLIDQAIWSLLHGSLFQQTICNALTTTDCFGLSGMSRFAIHFEPLLFPLSLLYLIWPGPKTLLVLQVVVVASGAFPAFWLARQRLRSSWAALPFAVLYLMYPTQQYSVNFDFHAVTLVNALLLFALYFLYVRKTLWFFLFVVLCLACKEEIAGVVVMLGLWVILLQRRWRVGLGLIALACGWTVIGLIVVHLSSPTGQSLLATRYSYLGNNPVQVVLNIVRHPVSIFKDHVLEHNHMLYLHKLLAPAGYLPLLAPWVLVLATPTLALNLLSSSPNMYRGDFQYNAEIVPILIFASIEAVVLIRSIVRWFGARLIVDRESQEPESTPRPAPARVQARSLAFLVQGIVLALVLCFLLARDFNSTTQFDVYSAMPYAHGFHWPSVSAHDQLATHFFNEIPADASVTTQNALAPHLSQRLDIYLFPYGVDHADYILLDATSTVYPFMSYRAFAASVKTILQRGHYGVVDMQDGYLLLKQGYPTGDPTPALRMIDQDDHLE